MARFNSIQYNLQATPGSRLLKPNEKQGRKRIAFAEYTIPATGFADGDSIDLFTIPAGARYCRGQMVFDDMGVLVVASVGDSVVNNRFATAVDVATAAGSVEIGSRTAALSFNETTKEELISVTLSGGTPLAGAVIKVELEYTVD